MKGAWKKIFLISLISWALYSCSRSGVIDDGNSGGGGSPHVINPTDTTAPLITIHTPAQDQVFYSGGVISITGRIADDFGLYRGTIRVINDLNGVALVNQPYEIHGVRTYEFNVSHTASVSTASDYTVVISFEDHGLNVTTKSVKVKVNP